MLLYITLGTNDLQRAGHFYDAVLGALGYRRQRHSEEEIGYSADGDTRCRFWVVTPFNRRRATAGNGAMVALAAETRAAVDAFHAAAIEAGAVDEGKPGLRSYHAHFYAAYVRDLDGNKLSAVCESPE
ncbi:VOC family protein [Rhizobium bangladeshense]|uniref:VOC family protein n=1 Tax=Rhizobium bangladeshense TaxID=1138189 RepID=UPI001A99EA2E|nr:VOC family protein [Rhizobium bangladeshense]MBX4865592.1 VOC family protein [Rhizobium bangladeshense]MBX4896328.1 VOC family protein [Rhizobium bangladeshense]MBX4902185.1 VOC family protein [Rhizobium bangladeshense]MBX4919984.1 VOC family protein [Rhizobium bangladeshense]MBY3596222.1 VOC family protein [Rhizobium bangladeshense]